MTGRKLKCLLLKTNQQSNMEPDKVEEVTESFARLAVASASETPMGYNEPMDRVETILGRVRRYRCDLLHSVDLPALEFPDGDKMWFLNRGGDLPSIEEFSGTKRWYLDGKLHRGNGKPTIVRADGTLEWYEHGKFVRKEIRTK